MPFATEQKVFGFRKESSRGVAEASPEKFLAVTPDSELNYNTLLIPDEKIRGLKERFPMSPGVKEGTGTLSNLDVEAQTIGDLLLGCLGNGATVQPDATNAPNTYRHTFTRLNSLLMPSFTFFVDRKISVKQYPLTIMKKLSFSGPTDGKASVGVDLLFKTEEAGPAISSNFQAPAPLMFFQTDFKIDGVSNCDVKGWTLNIDNGSVVQRTLCQTRDAKEILSPGNFIIDGGFEIYFETEVQRDKFLNVETAAIDIKLTGSLIEDTYHNELEFVLPQIKYNAYPFSNLDDLLGASVTFDAEYNATAGNSLSAILTNQVSSY